MEFVESEPRLSQMSTHWTAVLEAHSGAPEQVNPAVSRLMCRYAGAVHRYFLSAVKNPDEAQELDQEFAVRFLRGDFRRGHPDRGRFRDYVKRAVQNMITDHFRRKKASRSRTAPLIEPAVADPALERFDREFLASWRKDLLDRSWNALAELEKTSGQPYHTVLRFHVEHPELPSAKAAVELSRHGWSIAHRRGRAPGHDAIAAKVRRLSGRRSAAEHGSPQSGRARGRARRPETARILPSVSETAGEEGGSAIAGPYVSESRSSTWAINYCANRLKNDESFQRGRSSRLATRSSNFATSTSNAPAACLSTGCADVVRRCVVALVQPLLLDLAPRAIPCRSRP